MSAHSYIESQILPLDSYPDQITAPSLTTAEKSLIFEKVTFSKNGSFSDNFNRLRPQSKKFFMLPY